jgi:nitrite reductase (NADH) large subunit
MPDSAEVCGCNGVCKGTIVKAIQENGLFSLDEIKKHTKALQLLRLLRRPGEQILISTVGGAADREAENRKKPCAAAPT